MLTEVQGTKIYYEVTGNGPPLVFLHGLGCTGNVWQGQSVVLSKFFQVLTMDLPGAGRSDRTEPNYSMARWAMQLAGLADAARLDRFVLVAHSMTTVLAQIFAASHSTRLRGLVLCGPLTELPPAGKEAFQKRAELVQTEGMIAVADTVVGGDLTQATREGNGVLAGLYREMLLANDPRCYAGHCLALREGSARADQPHIKCPTLILVGDQDTVTPLANCQAIASAIPGTLIRIVPATAHATMVERPEAFNVALMEFLAGL